MITFKKVDFASLDEIASHLENNVNRFCELTPGNIYMWRNDLSTEFAIHEETLIVKKEYEKGRYAFLFPLGKNVLKALEEIDHYAFVNKIPLAFYAVGEEEEKVLESRYPHRQIKQNTDWSDYLYNLSDLRDLPGKRYESKRHNANKFHKLNPTATFKRATKEDEPRLNEFFARYLEENKGRDISLEEINLSKEMVARFCCLRAQMGYYEKDGKIIGFSMGERQGDTIYQHIEKALRQYDGIYQALTSDFLKMFGGDALYVNREEDDGNLGLREAKTQLHPVKMLEKRYFEVTNQIDLLKDIPDVIGERLSLRKMKEEDKESYFRLATGPKVNVFWGYDYHKDLGPNEEATPDFFFRDVQKDYETKNCLAFMIKSNEDGRLLGEAEIYDFRDDNSGEIGIRLKEEEQGKGYAKETMALIMKWGVEEAGLSSLRYECHLSNKASLGLAAHMGFKPTREDEVKQYLTYREEGKEKEGV